MNHEKEKAKPDKRKGKITEEMKLQENVKEELQKKRKKGNDKIKEKKLVIEDEM